jgi:trk system potassium uptake protein TrkH
VRAPNLSPNRLVVLGFAGAILVGTALLKLPAATSGDISWLDALFEATSAVTVTGLQVVDPPRDFTVFGQVVLAVLIQVGGLGIITATTLGVILIGGSASYRELVAANEEENLPGGPRNLRRLLVRIALFTLIIELAGALVLAGRLFSLGWDAAGALGHAVFHAISAFCNAGFSTFPGGVSRFDGDIFVNLAFVALILLGGLGFPVLVSLYRYPKDRRLTFHAKLVLAAYAVLTPLGILGFAALEWTNPRTLGGEPLLTKALESLFQGVTPRTAGFSTVSYSDLSTPTLATQIPLMFVGAAPASTGGGVKVMALALIFLLVVSQARGGGELAAFGRRIPDHYVRKTLALVSVAALLVFSGAVVIMISDGWGFLPALFHSTSALGTVGLSARSSAELGVFGKLLLILFMFVGRLGPITFLVALSSRSRSEADDDYPPGNIAVG